MDDRWEAILQEAGAMRPALVESAFRERALWLNMCRQAGIAHAHTTTLWAYINAVYQPDGTVRTTDRTSVGARDVDPAIVSAVAAFARESIQAGDRSGIDRREWVVDVPLPDDRRLVLTLREASGLGAAESALLVPH